MKLKTLQELSLTNPGNGTFSCPLAIGETFDWPDVGQCTSMINAGWCASVASEVEMQADTPATAVVGPHPPHPQDEVKG